MDRIELDELIEETDNVTERLPLLRKAWEMADAQHDYEAQIQYRLDYISDCCFYQDVMETYVIFPEVLRLHDEHVKAYGYDSMTPNILWDYKWLLENAHEFYQISEKQFETLFEDCKRRYLEQGYSPRPLYSYRFMFYVNSDREKAKEAYQDFHNSKRDWRSDCHACERCKEVQFFLALDEFGRAARAAKPVIEGELKCAEQPECTIGDFLRYYNVKLITGDADFAEPAGNLCEQLKRIIERKGTATSYMSEILLYYALQKPGKALGYYKKHGLYFEEIRNPMNKFHFGLAVLVFLSNLRGKETYKMELSPEFPFYRQDDTYSVKELTDYYMEKVSDIAQKLDARSQTSVYRQKLELVLENKFKE